MIKYISSSPEDTLQFAGNIASRLKPGDIIALNGDLGAGKTVFVKGIAAALCIDEHITSPTFNIVKEYRGKELLYHFDVYRISDIDELFEIGFDEYINGNGISIIEWAELIRDALPDDIIKVNIEGSGYEPRVITIEGENF